MTDLTRTLFRLSILEQASSTPSVSDEPSHECGKFLMESIFVTTIEDNTMLVDARPDIKRINLEPLDIDSIRKSQTKFLDKLHILHVSD